MKTFSFEYYSEIEDRHYHGNFTTKKLTIGDISRMGVIKAQLCGGLVYDPVSGKGVETHISNINEMISHCQVALVNHPEWWNPEEFIDPEILTLVWKEVVTFENSFRGRGTEGSNNGASVQNQSQEESQGEGGPTRSIEDLVDKKVPKITQLG